MASSKLWDYTSLTKGIIDWEKSEGLGKGHRVFHYVEVWRGVGTKVREGFTNEDDEETRKCRILGAKGKKIFRNNDGNLYLVLSPI